MKDGQSEILAQVRDSLKSAVLPSAHPAIPPRETARDVNRILIAEQFMRELDAIGVKVYCPPTTAEARDSIVGLVHAKWLEDNRQSDAVDSKPNPAGPVGDSGAPAASSPSLEVLAWEDSEIPLEGLGAALSAAGIARLDAMLPAEPALRRARLDELGRAAVGVTGALAGLADTGTLALSSGPTRPRLASLLPRVHIAVVAKSALYPTMAAFFSAHPDVVREASNLVFITGPSRTADIEQTLTIGVHGPREVHVVLVD